MSVLVDSSVWIDYFRSGKKSGDLDNLIDENMLVINELILAEILPPLIIKKQKPVVELLSEVSKVPLNIDWNEIVNFQVKCLKAGINGVGISDLIIVQSARQNGYAVFSLDKHFKQVEKVLKVKMYG